MADDLKDRGAQDRSRINVHEDHEVRYWTQKWSVSKEQLTAAVQKVGVSVDAVALELGERMTVQIDDFYRSSNGDRWRLVLDTETGHRTVRHEPNRSSGGRVTEIPMEDWLDRTGASPENAALRSLLEQSGDARRTE